MIFRSSVKKLYSGIKCSNKELLTKLSILLVINGLAQLAIGFTDQFVKTSYVVEDTVWLACKQTWGLLSVTLSQACLMMV
ncbi:hypothetical protein SARC_15639, partial [Sphaeroforma arctica JP610]